MDKLNQVFDIFVNSHVVYALGWTILHSIWQSALIAGMLALSLKLTQRASANTRYIQAVVAIVFCAIISLITFFDYYHSVTSANGILQNIQGELTLVYQQDWWTNVFTLFNPYLEYIVMFWLAGILLQSCRYGLDFSVSQRLRRQGHQSVPLAWQQRFENLVNELQIQKNVQFHLSSFIRIPCVIGHLKPVVLFPAGLLTQLPEEQLEAILLHELAHVKRHDYLVNLFQCVFKTLFFFNPMLLWMSKQVDIERENACDDIAVNQCGDPLLFANSLSRFAEVECQVNTAMAANKDQYFLLARVKRLFTHSNPLSAGAERLAAFLCIACLGLTVSVNADTTPVDTTSALTSKSIESGSIEAEERSLVNDEAEGEIANQIDALPVDLLPVAQSESDLVKSEKERLLKVQPETESFTINSSDTARAISTEEPKPAVATLEEPIIETQRQEITSQFNASNNDSTTLESRDQSTDVIAVQSNNIPPPAPVPVIKQTATSATDFIEQQEASLHVEKEIRQAKAILNEPQTSAADNELFMVLDTAFNRLILERPAEFNQFDGLFIHPISLSDTQVDSNFPLWTRRIKEAMPDIDTKLNAQIKTHNNKVSASSLTNPLGVRIRFVNFTHYLNHSGSAEFPHWRSHLIRAFSRIELIDELNGKPIGVIGHTFTKGSGNGKGIRGNDIANWHDNSRSNVWSDFIHFVSDNLAKNVKHINSHEMLPLGNTKDSELSRGATRFLFNTNFDKVIASQSFNPANIKGVKIVDIDTSEMAVNSDYDKWQNRIERYLPEVMDIFNAKTAEHNNRLNELADGKLLHGKIRIKAIKHRSGPKERNSWRRAKLGSHVMETALEIALINPTNGEIVALGERRFYFVKPLKRGKYSWNLSVIKNREQAQFWNRISDFMLSNVDSIIDGAIELKKSDRDTFQPSQEVLVENGRSMEKGLDITFYSLQSEHFERVSIKSPDKFRHFESVELLPLAPKSLSVVGTSEKYQRKAAELFASMSEYYNEKADVLNQPFTAKPDKVKLLAQVKSVQFSWSKSWHNISTGGFFRTNNQHVEQSQLVEPAIAFENEKTAEYQEINSSGFGQAPLYPRSKFLSVLTHVEFRDAQTNDVLGIAEHLFYPSKRQNKRFFHSFKNPLIEEQSSDIWPEIVEYLSKNSMNILHEIEAQPIEKIERPESLLPVSFLLNNPAEESGHPHSWQI